MEHIQDGITYKIKDDQVKGWKGTSPFKIPFWDVNTETIIEGADSNYEADRLASAKVSKIELLKAQYAQQMAAYEFEWKRAFFKKKNLPVDIETSTEAIFTTFDVKEAEINALLTLEEVLNYTI